MTEKSSSTSFWVHASPKSWLKYTTLAERVFAFVVYFDQLSGAAPTQKLVKIINEYYSFIFSCGPICGTLFDRLL